MATLLLVDDHPLFREGFAQMTRALRPDWRLHLASSADEANCALADRTVDLVVIDINLPDRDGFRLCEEVRALRPTPCVLISGREDEGARIRARASGAGGLIAKSASPEDIVALVDRVLNGGNAFGACPRGEDGALPDLTLRQAEVLGLLAEGHGNKEIRHRLGIAERTVRAHLTDLFQLLGAHSRTQAIIRAREMGLIA